MIPILNMQFSVVVALTSLFLHVTSAQLIYGKVGGTVDLDPGTVNGKITSVTWKHGSDIAMEGFGNDITYYRDFRGRCGFNTITGVLTITSLTLNDSGTYKAEVNSKDAGSQELRVLILVPKPSVSVECNEDETVCNLTCDFNTTPEMGGVDQTWVVDGEDEPSGSNKMTITYETKKKEFICKLKNPVSTKSSDAVINPLLNRGAVNAGIIVLIILVVLVMITLIVFVIIVYGTKWFDNNGVIHYLREKGLLERLTSICTGNKDNQAEDTGYVPVSTLCQPTSNQNDTSNNLNVSENHQDPTHPHRPVTEPKTSNAVGSYEEGSTQYDVVALRSSPFNENRSNSNMSENHQDLTSTQRPVNGSKTSNAVEEDVTVTEHNEPASALLKDQEAPNQVQIAVGEPKTSLGPSDSSDTPEPPVNQIVTSAFIHSSHDATDSPGPPELPDEGETPATDSNTEVISSLYLTS